MGVLLTLREHPNGMDCKQVPRLSWVVKAPTLQRPANERWGADREQRNSRKETAADSSDNGSSPSPSREVRQQSTWLAFERHAECNREPQSTAPPEGQLCIRSERLPSSCRYRTAQKESYAGRKLLYRFNSSASH